MVRARSRVVKNMIQVITILFTHIYHQAFMESDSSNQVMASHKCHSSVFVIIIDI